MVDTVKLGIVMDPIDRINIKKDTSFALLLAAQQRNWRLHYMEMGDLFFDDSRACARTQNLSVKRDPEQWYELSEPQELALADLDVILMRKDPPFDLEYIYATYLLELAEQAGCLVINKPQSLRDANEKLFTSWFPQCCANTLVTRDPQRIRAFLKRYHEIILKPLDGMGGASIFHVREQDSNLSVILEIMTQHASRFVMAQKYLPEIVSGDKRILIVDGEPIPFALARIPAQGESRGNLAAGGRAEGRPLTERDYWIASQVGPVLRRKGLVFVGIDVIGDYLTEINVTSPTCVQELEQQFDIDICGKLMDYIEKNIH